MDINYLKNNSDVIPREFLDLFEYRRFSTDKLRQVFLARLENYTENENIFFISSFKDKIFKGYMLFKYMFYDSEIFGFNVYKISDFCFLGNDCSENEYIIKCLLNELENKINVLNIKYLTISINANIPISSLVFNSLIKNNFYYINTLVTFKMEKEEFKRVKLFKAINNDIKIRFVKKEDRDALFEIASKSHKINRLSLDRNLNKEKCDLLYAKSAVNSILHGFADVIFVAEYKNEVVGYYSAKKNFNSISNIMLGKSIISGVAEKARGLRAFSLMNNSILKWFYENTDLAEMGTYIINIPVHKTWTNNGLNIIRGSYHLARFCK